MKDQNTIIGFFPNPEEKNYRIDANFRWLGSEIKENEELCLTVCGIEYCKKDKVFGPIIREDYHVHVILKGQGTLKVGGVSYPLHRGQIFTTFPGAEVYYYANPSDPWSYTWISFAGTRAAHFLEKAGITADSPIRDTYISPEDYLAIAEKILNHHQLTVANELIRTASLYEFLSLLISSYTDHHPLERKEPLDYSSDVYVKSAVEYIHGHYAALRVSDIAEYIGISRYYLTHLFKEKLNTSPQDYLLNYKMEQSSHLLCSTDLSVAEIAALTGYDNPLTFSKAFKKRYGLSPSNYRMTQCSTGVLEDQ